MGAAAPLRSEARNAPRMIVLEDLLNRLRELDRRELTRWVENRWVLPERRNETWIFHEVAIDDEALPLVLGLLDQVYDLRRQLRRVCDALAAQSPEVRAVICKA